MIRSVFLFNLMVKTKLFHDGKLLSFSKLNGTEKDNKKSLSWARESWPPHSFTSTTFVLLWALYFHIYFCMVPTFVYICSIVCSFSLVIVSRDGNRPGRPTGAYSLAYLKPSSTQLV